ncbi:GNAT family N-acetyltransferase [Arsukibacterium sp.]|uniref:GNAT family N-acetyltransferase n=1 Tax=Arsukibacterium sp. TaxID=1977258 RepID=UPI00299D5E34|nr:GNAT family N-acetyltransferase [Arsukibacterium sp.]MDX1678395.1 GNAT family N-acetyltransferase [Arsukibacterium sp.]
MSDNLVTTWYLQYQGPALAQPDWPADCLLMEATLASPELGQFLFSAVGNHWRWFSRLNWDYQQWLDYLSNPSVRTWVLYKGGSPAGFAELKYHPDNGEGPSVELKFFGLMPAFIGQGLGSTLLYSAIALSQQWLAATLPDNPATPFAPNIWVHTCSDDHPAALATYQKAGFKVYRTQQDIADAPENYANAALCHNYIYSRLTYFKSR